MTTDALHPDVFPIFADGLGWGNFDVVVLPHPKGKSLVNWAGFGGFSVSSKTTNPRAAVELVKFLGAGSKIWWPDPTLKSGIAAFISASNEKYPNLKNTHFGAAFNLGATKVQFAYTSNPFGVGRYADADWAAFRDKLWVGNAKPDDLKTLVPQWNAKFAPGLERDLKQVPLLAAYGEALQKLLKQVKAQ